MAKDQIYLNFFVSLGSQGAWHGVTRPTVLSISILPQIVKSLQIIDCNVYGIKNNSYLCSR